MSSAKPAVFFKFQFLWCVFLVFCGGVIPVLALGTPQRNYISHNCTWYHFNEGAQQNR
jgi:hypothetical protein